MTGTAASPCTHAHICRGVGQGAAITQGRQPASQPASQPATLPPSATFPFEPSLWELQGRLAQRRSPAAPPPPPAAGPATLGGQPGTAQATGSGCQRGGQCGRVGPLGPTCGTTRPADAAATHLCLLAPLPPHVAHACKLSPRLWLALLQDDVHGLKTSGRIGAALHLVMGGMAAAGSG